MAEKEINLLLATKNRGKVREFETIFAGLSSNPENVALPHLRLLTLADIGYDAEIEENGTSFEENARIKARAAAALGFVGVADDSGLCVNALGGAPGILSARYSGGGDEENNKKLLRELSEAPDRSAYYYCAIACAFPDGRGEFTVSGQCRGIILRDYRGTGGFGYDPLFFSEDLGKSFGEAAPDEKAAVSHRGKAVRAFAREFYERLRNTNG